MVFAILSCVFFTFTLLMIMRVPSLNISVCFTGGIQDLWLSQCCC